MSAKTQGGGFSSANLSQLYAVGAHAIVFSFLCSLLGQFSQFPAKISIFPSLLCVGGCRGLCCANTQALAGSIRVCAGGSAVHRRVGISWAWWSLSSM